MSLNAKLNVRSALSHFFPAYILVTVLAYAASFLVGMTLQPSPPPPPGASIFDSPEFVKSVPYHLLINAVIWTFFSYQYFKRNKNRELNITVALYLGLFWLVSALIVDLILFVLIPSPVVLTFHQFYIEYEPWIGITYLIVLISPLVSYQLIKNRIK